MPWLHYQTVDRPGVDLLGILVNVYSAIYGFGIKEGSHIPIGVRYLSRDKWMHFVCFLSVASVSECLMRCNLSLDSLGRRQMAAGIRKTA